MEISNDVKIKGHIKIRKYKDGKLIYSQEEDNKVVSSSGHGRNLLTRQLAGDTTYQIAIDEGKIGDDDTAPTDSDTDLGNVVLDGIVIENATFSNDQCTFQMFILDASLPNGTYKEFGLFIDGQMFARALFTTPYVKGSGEDTRVDYTITISG